MLNGWMRLAMSAQVGTADWIGSGSCAGSRARGAPGLRSRRRLQRPAVRPHEVYVPIPGFDTTSIDTTVDPCNDFYKFACGKFAANHPIPADQPSVDQFYALYNVNTQSLNGILDEGGGGWRGAVGG